MAASKKQEACTNFSCPIRDYFESRLDALDEQMNVRIEAAGTALDLASRATDRRLDDLNHIREQQREANAQFVNRETYDAQHMFLASRVDQVNTFFNKRIDDLRDKEEYLEKLAANLQGKMWMLAACLGAAFTVMQLLLKFIIR